MLESFAAAPCVEPTNTSAAVDMSVAIDVGIGTDVRYASRNIYVEQRASKLHEL